MINLQVTDKQNNTNFNLVITVNFVVGIAYPVFG